MGQSLFSPNTIKMITQGCFQLMRLLCYPGFDLGVYYSLNKKWEAEICLCCWTHLENFKYKSQSKQKDYGGELKHINLHINNIAEKKLCSGHANLLTLANNGCLSTAVRGSTGHVLAEKHWYSKFAKWKEIHKKTSLRKQALICWICPLMLYFEHPYRLLMIVTLTKWKKKIQ